MSEKLPEQPMTVDQAREAYQRGDEAAFERWYHARLQEREGDRVAQFQLSVDVARIYYGAGDREKAKEAISGVNMGIQEELIELDRYGSSAYERPDKEEYRGKLKELLKHVTLLRSEFLRK